MTDPTSASAALQGEPEPARKDAQNLFGDPKGLVANAADRVLQASDRVRRRVGDGAEVARDWAADRSDVLRDTVQTKPFIAVGVSAAAAFAAGLALGVSLARR